MTGAVKLNTAGGGSVVVQPASSIASDVTVNVPSVGVSGGTLVCSDSSGNVGIGITNPVAKVNLSDGSTIAWGTSNYPYIGGDSSTNYVSFGTQATERMRIDSSGNLLVGINSSLASGAHAIVNTSNEGILTLRNSSTIAGRYFGLGPDANNNCVVYNQSGVGVYINNGATSWTANSDERIKDIIEPIENAVQKVSTLRAVIGKYKKDEEGTRRSFLIAQDVQKVLPEAVNVQTDEIGTLGLQYTDVIPLLVAAIKELKAGLDATKAEVAALKGAA